MRTSIINYLLNTTLLLAFGFLPSNWAEFWGFDREIESPALAGLFDVYL